MHFFEKVLTAKQHSLWLPWAPLNWSTMVISIQNVVLQQELRNGDVNVENAEAKQQLNKLNTRKWSKCTIHTIIHRLKSNSIARSRLIKSPSNSFFNAQSIKDWKIAQLLIITICYLIEASYRIYALSNLKSNKSAIKSIPKSVPTHFQTSIIFTLNRVILTVFSLFFCFSKRFWRWGNICYE